MKLETRGTVKARTEGTLVPQVSGRIEEVSPYFRDGGFFERNDMLVQIERDRILEQVYHEVDWAFSAGTTAAFTVATLGVACWLFRRRDY